jgi:MFS family permease
MVYYLERMDELKPHSRPALPLISAITFLGFLDSYLLIPVISLYATDLGASPGISGLIIGIYSMTNTPANVFFGRLLDRIGYKLSLVAGLLGDALSMFLYSLSRNPLHLALTRAVHGTSGGLVGPATMSIFASYDMTTRGRMMSIYGTSLAVATLVGFSLSGIIVSRFGYGALFLFGTIILAVGAGLCSLLPGRGKHGNAEHAPVEDFTPLSDLFRRRGLIVAYASVFAQYFTFGGVVTLAPLYIRGLGMGAFHSGILLATFSLAFIIVQLIARGLSDRVGRNLPTVAGIILGIFTLVILPSLKTFPLLTAAMALYGVAFALLFPSISALVADYTNQYERGAATGIFHALLTAGVAIGAPVMGWVGGVVGIELGLTLIPGIMVLALIAALTLLRTRKKAGSP